MNTNEDPTTPENPAAEAGEPATTPPTTPPSDSFAAPVTTAERPASSQLRPRTGTIVWGVLVLAFCAFTSFQTIAPNRVDGTTFVIAAMIGIGLLLLAVGTAVVVRSARQRRR